MPVVLRANGFVVFFYSNEGSPLERMHVHVRRGSGNAKVWISPEVRLQVAYGMSRADVRAALNLVAANLQELRDAWDDYFGVG